MNPFPLQPDAEFEEARELINRLLDGELSPDDAQVLERIVCARRDVRQYYVLNLHLWCNLAPHFVASPGAEHDAESGRPAGAPGHTPRASADEPSLMSGDAMVLPAMGEDDDTDAEPISLPPLIWPNPRPAVTRGPRAWWIAASAGLAAALMIGVSAVFFLTRSTRVASAPPSVPAPTVSESPAAKDTVVEAPPAPRPTATLASAVSAEWDTPGTPLVTGVLLPSGPLGLKAGLAEIRFENGVRMIVEAPARFEIVSDMRTDLLRGKVVATVPPAAAGFVVSTRSTQVVDLGTEFGVEVDTGGSTRVEVFQGKIQASAPATPTTATPTTSFHNRQLVAGEAARVAAGAAAAVDVPVVPLSFVREDEFAARGASQGGSDYAHWLAYTFQIRRDPSLVAFYMFEKSAGNAERLANRAAWSAGRFDFPLGYAGNPATRPEWVPGRWPEKRALDFRLGALQGSFLPEFPYTTNGRLTVSAWVYARSWAPWAAIAKNRGETKDTTGQFSLGLFGTDGTLVGRVTQEDRAEVLVREPVGMPLPLRQWVHVVMVADGAMLRLYRDGIEVALVPCAGPLAAPEPKSLSIGYRAGAGPQPSQTNFGEFWDGAIDELAIYHRALSAEEVRGMFDAGKPGN